jgi:hypothetical protein
MGYRKAQRVGGLDVGDQLKLGRISTGLGTAQELDELPDQGRAQFRDAGDCRALFISTPLATDITSAR